MQSDQHPAIGQPPTMGQPASVGQPLPMGHTQVGLPMGPQNQGTLPPPVAETVAPSVASGIAGQPLQLGNVPPPQPQHPSILPSAGSIMAGPQAPYPTCTCHAPVMPGSVPMCSLHPAAIYNPHPYPPLQQGVPTTPQTPPASVYPQDTGYFYQQPVWSASPAPHTPVPQLVQSPVQPVQPLQPLPGQPPVYHQSPPVMFHQPSQQHAPPLYGPPFPQTPNPEMQAQAWQQVSLGQPPPAPMKRAPTADPNGAPAFKKEKPDPMVRMDSVASTQELTFPDKLAGVIIGKSGWRLKSLQDRTRTKIILKDLMEKSGGQEKKAPRVMVTVTGDKDRVDNAARLIMDLIQEHQRLPALKQGGLKEEDTPASGDAPTGAPGMLKDVVTSSEQPARQSNGCPAAAKDPSAEAVASAGHAGATAPAHSPWASTMPQTWQSHMSMEDTMMRRIAECKVKTEMECPAHLTGCVIGTKGSIVKDTMRQSGTMIFLPKALQRSNRGKSLICIGGDTPQAVAQAKKIIEDALARNAAQKRVGAVMNP